LNNYALQVGTKYGVLYSVQQQCGAAGAHEDRLSVTFGTTLTSTISPLCSW